LAEKSKHCKFGDLLVSLDSEEREAVNYVVHMVIVDDEKKQNKRIFTRSWLSQLLRSNGYDIGKTVISNHLAGKCGTHCGSSE